MTPWNPTQYLRFADFRTQPARDLALQLWGREARSVLDIGCGPGTSTAVLRAVLPHADVTGMDADPAMLARARADHPDLVFEQGDAARVQGTWDVLFSNSCLQWVPDHRTLLGSLMDHLEPGGILAVQMPMNDDAPLYRAIKDTAEAWGLHPQDLGHQLLSIPEYEDLLARRTSVWRVWETVYHHRLASRDALIAWVRGSRLRPYEALLAGETERHAFEREILAKAAPSYPEGPDGSIDFAFRRLFLTAEADA